MRLKSIIQTPIGEMLAISSNGRLQHLHFLEPQTSYDALSSSSGTSIEEELELYFSGNLETFRTPIELIGTDFQKDAWNELTKIEYGTTINYNSQATQIGRPKSYRAVASANAANKLAIIVPCHRVIASSGKISGYNGGIERKQWLLEHERRNKSAV